MTGLSTVFTSRFLVVLVAILASQAAFQLLGPDRECAEKQKDADKANHITVPPTDPPPTPSEGAVPTTPPPPSTSDGAPTIAVAPPTATSGTSETAERGAGDGEPAFPPPQPFVVLDPLHPNATRPPPLCPRSMLGKKEWPEVPCVPVLLQRDWGFGRKASTRHPYRHKLLPIMSTDGRRAAFNGRGADDVPAEALRRSFALYNYNPESAWAIPVYAFHCAMLQCGHYRSMLISIADAPVGHVIVAAYLSAAEQRIAEELRELADAFPTRFTFVEVDVSMPEFVSAAAYHYAFALRPLPDFVLLAEAGAWVQHHMLGIAAVHMRRGGENPGIMKVLDDRAILVGAAVAALGASPTLIHTDLIAAAERNRLSIREVPMQCFVKGNEPIALPLDPPIELTLGCIDAPPQEYRETGVTPEFTTAPWERKPLDHSLGFRKAVTPPLNPPPRPAGRWQDDQGRFPAIDPTRIYAAFAAYDADPGAINALPVYTVTCAATADCDLVIDHIITFDFPIGHFIVAMSRDEHNIFTPAFTELQDLFPGRFTLVSNPDMVVGWGFAQSTNAALRHGFAVRPEPHAVIVANADLTMRPGFGALLARTIRQESTRADVMLVAWFSSFITTLRGWRNIGQFDEGMYPLFFEDDEMLIRLKAAKAPYFRWPNLRDLTHNHVGSSSQRASRMGEWMASFGHDEYLFRKWGVDVSRTPRPKFCQFDAGHDYNTQVVFTHPWNHPGIPYREAYAMDPVQIQCVLAGNAKLGPNLIDAYPGRGARWSRPDTCFYNVSVVEAKFNITLAPWLHDQKRMVYSGDDFVVPRPWAEQPPPLTTPAAPATTAAPGGDTPEINGASQSP